MSDNIKVLLVGCGYMGIEYTKVLTAMNVDIFVVGNSATGVKKYKEDTGVTAFEGGLDNYLNLVDETHDIAIVATPMTILKNNTISLIRRGTKKILLEKPGGMNKNEISEICQEADEHGTKVYIAYNRRFYASTEKALKIMEEDEGVKSVYYEFTEWASSVEASGHTVEELEAWLLGNSTHVIDLAFFLGGDPVQMTSYITGSLDWHSSGSVYAGAGVTDKGALFTYNANWQAPGRWGVEILTNQHRLIFRPMEKLQIQGLNSAEIREVYIDDELDRKFKPGLYKQVEAFLSRQDDSRLKEIHSQMKHMDIYEEIAGIDGKGTIIVKSGISEL